MICVAVWYRINVRSKLPEKVTVQLLKSDTQLPDKDRIVKETVKESFFDALDFGFVWLERALKN